MDHADIAIGIPSFNEAATISNVATQIDRGLQRPRFQHYRAIIVNVDNDSQDDTKARFLSTPTHSPKLYVSTPAGVRGKGENVRKFLDLCTSWQVRAGATFDADLENISPCWIEWLLAPILDENYDFVYPVYRRHPHDGTTTNLLCRPVIAGAFCLDIAQPIGGDFALSGAFADHLSRVTWPARAHAYGIDIFLTTEALLSGFRVCGSELGNKIHRRRERSTTEPTASDIASVLLAQVIRTQGIRAAAGVLRRPAVYENRVEAHNLPYGYSTDLQAVKGVFCAGFSRYKDMYESVVPRDLFTSIAAMAEGTLPIHLDIDTWALTLRFLIRAYASHEEGRQVIAASTVPLLFGRMLSFMDEVGGMSMETFDEYLLFQSKRFHSVFGAGRSD